MGRFWELNPKADYLSPFYQFLPMLIISHPAVQTSRHPLYPTKFSNIIAIPPKKIFKICVMEISTETSISFLEGSHVIEREITSHRINKTDNSNFMLAQKLKFPCQLWCACWGSNPELCRRRARFYPIRLQAQRY